MMMNDSIFGRNTPASNSELVRQIRFTTKHEKNVM